MMIDVISTYIIFLLAFQPIEEVHNCNNPNTLGENPHFICAWDDKDFVYLKNGDRVLRTKREKDNFIKAYYRKRWYSKR